MSAGRHDDESASKARSGPGGSTGLEGASTRTGSSAPALPPGAAARALFPALNPSNGPVVVPLDNAATTHRPQSVLDALQRFYIKSNANVHRAVHREGQAATAAYEGARGRVARFLEASPEQVVFTRNATDAINLVARGYVEPRVGPGDAIVVTALEHHSNLVPWQQVCRRTGARLHVLPVDDDGRLAEPWELPEDGRFLAATRVSNALGSLVPTERLVPEAQARGMAVLLDVTQALGHLPLDDGSRAAEFLACSAHKAYGPMGVGILRGQSEALEHTEPVVFGGEMVDSVDERSATWAPVPLRFEAGTPAAAPVAAFVPALDLLDRIGLPAIRAHELALLQRLLEGLAVVDGVELVGPPLAEQRSGSTSLVIPGGDPHVAATVLDLAGVAVRVGWHCAEPLLRRMGRGPSVRASLALYSTADDIDHLLSVLPEAVEACR